MLVLSSSQHPCRYNVSMLVLSSQHPCRYNVSMLVLSSSQHPCRYNVSMLVLSSQHPCRYNYNVSMLRFSSWHLCIYIYTSRNKYCSPSFSCNYSPSNHGRGQITQSHVCCMCVCMHACIWQFLDDTLWTGKFEAYLIDMLGQFIKG